MEEIQFEQAMEIIRSKADRVFLLEGDRKPILIVSLKEKNDHVELFASQIDKVCKDRLDFVLLEGCDEVKIGEKSTELEKKTTSTGASKLAALDI